MTNEKITSLCLSKPKAYINYPFGEIPICFKVAGKIFAELYPNENDHKITLKCEPMTADFYRREYPDIVVCGYHCPPVQAMHRNTVFIEKINDELLVIMIEMSYNEVIKALPKKKRDEIMSENETT